MKLFKSTSILVLLFIFSFSCNNKEKPKTQPVTKNTTTTTEQTPLKRSIKRGKLIYDDFCMTCHLANGKGVTNTFPPLANSDYLKNNRTASIKGIKYGQNGEIVVNGVTYNGAMAAPGLEDDEIADVMNYINHSWDNDYGERVTKKEVAKIEK